MTPLLSATLLIFYSVITLWRVSVFARKSQRPMWFIPFFAWAILINALAAFIYYEMTFTFLWFLLDLLFFATYASLLAIITAMLKSIKHN